MLWHCDNCWRVGHKRNWLSHRIENTTFRYCSITCKVEHFKTVMRNRREFNRG